MNNEKLKIVVAVTGASGAIYAKVLFDRLQSLHDRLKRLAYVCLITLKPFGNLN